MSYFHDLKGKGGQNECFIFIIRKVSEGQNELLTFTNRKVRGYKMNCLLS